MVRLIFKLNNIKNKFFGARRIVTAIGGPLAATDSFTKQPCFYNDVGRMAATNRVLRSASGTAQFFYSIFRGATSMQTFRK